MSTLMTEEPAVQAEAAVSSSLLMRLIRWYRAAVTEPATAQEEADWQKNSF